MLKLEGVVKQYSYGKRLYGAVDLTVENGEILSVLGGTGSGKTTFLKTISGIDDHEGTITLDGTPPSAKTDDVIMVFDDGALFPFKTVFDNLAYPLKIRGVDKVEIAKRVVQAAEKFGLVACLKMRPKSLSAVEKRKVSLARILMRDVKLILLDDFLSDLTRKDADDLFSEATKVLYTLAKDKGTSVIFVTDNPRYAFSFGDRTMVLVGGDVKQIGTYTDIYNHPHTVWSAEAVDENYNALKGTLTAENDNLNFVFSVFGQNLSLDVTCLKDQIQEDYIGKEVLCGWHGKDVAMTEDGIKMDVNFSKRIEDKFVLEGADSFDRLKVVTDQFSDQISFLPVADKVHFFDVRENSVMKRN